MANELIDSLRRGDLGRVRLAIEHDSRAARSARAICEAAGLAFQAAIELLVEQGADLNASWRGYRPLHNLIQTSPHSGDGAASTARFRCLEWLLQHGADPDEAGAWPPARAVIIAAFSGRPDYVARLLRKGDAFAAAALGDKHTVEMAVRSRSEFAHEGPRRPHGPSVRRRVANAGTSS